MITHSGVPAKSVFHEAVLFVETHNSWCSKDSYVLGKGRNATLWKKKLLDMMLYWSFTRIDL